MAKSKKKDKRYRQLNLFDDYNYEETYKHHLENLSEHFIENLFFTQRYKVSYMTKVIKSGNQKEVEIYPIFKGNELPTNIVRRKETRQEQKNLNSRNSRKMLERKVHCNFSPGDLWIHGTFSKENEPKNLEDAQRLFKNFIKAINRRRKKLSLPNAKYIYVIEQGEYGTERYHVHFVMDNELNRDEVEEKWKYGFMNAKVISYREDENLLGICKYMTKDPEVYKKTQFRLKGKRLWSCSKGLKGPVERTNRTAFSKKKVLEMVKHRNGIGEILEKKYRNYSFKGVEVRYNDYNGLFYIYARMQDRRRVMRN